MSHADLSEMTDHDLLIRIATQMSELAGNGQPGRCAVHSIRIRRLELWRSWLAGAIAVCAAIISLCGAMLSGMHK